MESKKAKVRASAEKSFTKKIGLRFKFGLKLEEIVEDM